MHPGSPGAETWSRVGGDIAVLCRSEGGGRWKASAHPSSGAIRPFWSLLSSAALAKFRCTASEAFLLTQGKKALLLLCFCLQSMPRCVSRASRGDLGCVCSGFLCREGKSPLLSEGLPQPLAQRRGDARSSASISRELSLESPSAWTWTAYKLLCAATRDGPGAPSPSPRGGIGAGGARPDPSPAPRPAPLRSQSARLCRPVRTCRATGTPRRV